MARIVQHPKRTLWVQAYIPEAIRGLYTTLKHFLRGLFKYETLPTIPYPDIKPPIPKNYRSKHRLLMRADGTPRCVACGMCAAACPARCIKIEAGESPSGQIEKRAVRFEIDHLTCVFCGLCVEACPADAIRMDTGETSFVHDKREVFMRLLSAIFVCIALFMPAFAGTMQVENLNRGLIAVRAGQGYYLSWRLLANEPYNTGFNVYRGETKLNSAPITGATIYTDASAAQNSSYTVRAVVDGAEQSASESAMIINSTEGSNSGYININLQRPPTGAQGGTYSPGDGSTGDLNGDGVYEIVLKWDPSNAKDNSQSGITDNVLIDAYTLTGERLWRIDLGQNIRAGAHYTQFLVYDFDGDGKAEIMMKTAPGTKDGSGANIKMGPAANANHSTAYRNTDGYVLSGPEYLTVFNGETGKEMATVDYWPARGTVSSWGDNYGNRVDRFNATVAYVDGEKPSAVFQRGYYTRMTFAVWDWRNGQLTQKWTFDSNASGNSGYAGQGNHQISVADANGDGKHDIITGAAVIGGDGKGLHRTGWGHGDALHVAHTIKGHPTPQIFMPHEDKSTGHGVLLRQASDGKTIFNHPKADADVGRGCAAELDKNVPGFKFWAASSLGLYDLEGKVVGNIPSSINHVIWWDGDLTRALLDGNQINKWNVRNNSATRLLTATGFGHINGTKSNPVLQADLFGDWREEVIFANGTNALRIYTTTMPTTNRLVTLMHDPVYRVAVSWQNSSYNQPPHPGYYIASNMDFPPPTLDVKVIGSLEQPSSSSAAQSSSSVLSSSSAQSSSSAPPSSSSVVQSSSSAPPSSSSAVQSSSSVSPSSSSEAQSSSSSNEIMPAMYNQVASTHFSVRSLNGKTLLVEVSSPTVMDIFDLNGKKAASYNVSGLQTLHLSLQSGVYFAKAHGYLQRIVVR